MQVENLEASAGPSRFISNDAMKTPSVRPKFSCMMFSQYSNCIITGRNSAGADGNITRIELPGNMQTRFSGVGVYPLNGKDMHETGIQSDIYIERTKEHMVEGKDEVGEWVGVGN